MKTQDKNTQISELVKHDTTLDGIDKTLHNT
jgi:hypothetical protein